MQHQRDAAMLVEESQRLHAAGDIKAGLRTARRALELDPDNVQAMEHVANVLITRQQNYSEGLALVDRMVALRPDDAGLWYSRGWCYEFAAHELRRRPTDSSLDPLALLKAASASFRHCLDLGPEGKLADDAMDLLDHVENVLKSPQDS